MAATAGRAEHEEFVSEVLLAPSERAVVDVLLTTTPGGFDVTNPGLWMARCHIAERMESGMMFSFTVARQAAAE